MMKKTGHVVATFHGRPRFYAHKIINGAILGLILIFTLGKLVMAQVWERIIPSGTPPDKRNGHVLISPGGSEQFVFGGFDQDDDLWILRREGGENWRWENMDAGGDTPGTRGGHSGIFAYNFDSSIIIFGGSQVFEGVLVDSATYRLEDPWNWDSAWEKLSTGGAPPSARAEHTAVYDYNNNMVVFGGYTSPDVASSETYTLGLGVGPPAQWTKESTSGAIPARYGHSAVWADWQMVVFGGKDSSGGLLNDCWRLESSSWFEISVSGDKPSARWQHSAFWIPGGPMESGGMLIFGGEDEQGNPLDDVWFLQGPGAGQPDWEWEKFYPIGNFPSARSGHAAAGAASDGDGEGEMFIFGGFDGNENLNDVYVLSEGDKVEETLEEEGPFNAPNPFNPDIEETKICYYLDKDDNNVKIKLFTLTGDLVYSWENISGRKGLNQWPWNGKNEKGRIVENGGYICLIEAGGKKQKCKIAILR